LTGNEFIFFCVAGLLLIVFLFPTATLSLDINDSHELLVETPVASNVLDVDSGANKFHLITLNYSLKKI
jgi:hypothetical protein